jgi:hypothetical protein
MRVPQPLKQLNRKGDGPKVPFSTAAETPIHDHLGDLVRFGICSSSTSDMLTAQGNGRSPAYEGGIGNRPDAGRSQEKMRRKTQMQAEGATRKLRAKRSKY